MDKNMKVAIVGGGVSGLSVAYELLSTDAFTGEVTIFEKSATLGGNAATAEVILGHDFRDNATTFTRMADLGVNDINLNTYIRTRAVMEKIGYFDPDTCQTGTCADADTLCELEDSVCHFDLDGREIWTKDGYLIDAGDAHPHRKYIVDMRFSLDAPEHRDLREAEEHFMTTAAEDYDPQKAGEAHWNFTTAQYIKHYRERHLSPHPHLLDDVVRLFLYPRISAMYFADDAGPDVMPFRGIMSYYRLQEGFETGKERPDPDRRYFTKGSHDWIEALAQYLRETYPDRFSVVMNYKARVIGDGDGGVLVYKSVEDKGLPRPERFDKVVMAAHADHQLESFAPCEDFLLSDEMAENLARINYSDSTSIAHTFTGVLPPNKGSWRTYNVLIRDGTELPYQMTYVQNRHRNDRFKERHNAYGQPLYFVSLNPERAIPDKFILRRTEKDRQRQLANRPGYAPHALRAEMDADKAIGYFRHTVMTRELLEIQDQLESYQGMADNRVYFAGCWCIGAGLHEECFQQAEKVKKAVLE